VSTIIGVDAGGTSTTAVVWRDGLPVGRAVGGAGAVRPTRAVAAATRIADTVRSALSEARLLRADVLVVGAAGVGRSEEREELRTALRMHDLAERTVIITDIELALAAAFGGDPGIVLIAGTGSIAVARRPDGTIARAGGHGWQMGDEGSGYWIGRMALQAIARAADGRGGASRLMEEIGPIIRITRFEELVRWSVTAAPSEVAALAPGVAAAAAAGDAMAAAILDRATEELVALVAALAPAPAAPPIPIALSGGLLAPGRPLRDRVTSRLSGLPGVIVREGPLDPVAGALVLAGG